MFFILNKPIFFFLKFLFEFNGLQSLIIYIFHKVDSSLFFSSPFVLFHFPLLFRLKPCQMFYQLFFSSFIFSLLQVILLEINNLLSSSNSFFLLKSFDFLFPGECIMEHFPVPVLFQFELLFTQLFFSIVVSNEF